MAQRQSKPLNLEELAQGMGMLQTGASQPQVVAELSCGIIKKVCFVQPCKLTFSCTVVTAIGSHWIFHVKINK